VILEFEHSDFATCAVEFLELPNEASAFTGANAANGTLDSEGVLLA
jgi:hypothetical protein